MPEYFENHISKYLIRHYDDTQKIAEV